MSREDRIQELEKAAADYLKSRREQIQKDSDLAKRLLKGRTGKERLSGVVNDATSDRLLQEIIDFSKGIA